LSTCRQPAPPRGCGVNENEAVDPQRAFFTRAIPGPTHSLIFVESKKPRARIAVAFGAGRMYA